jgi:hypothetical protein
MEKKGLLCHIFRKCEEFVENASAMFFIMYQSISSERRWGEKKGLLCYILRKCEEFVENASVVQNKIRTTNAAAHGYERSNVGM